MSILREELLALPKTHILDLFGILNKTGKPGFDHERSKKSECVDRLLNEFNSDDILQAVACLPQIDNAVVVAERPKAVPAAPAMAMDPSGVAAQIAALFGTMAASAVDESKVRAIVDEVIGQRVPRAVEIRVNGEPKAQLNERTHPAFDKVVKLAASGVNVMLVGPAGCGKTHLSHQVAKALGKTFGSISGSAGVSEAQLTGRLLPTGEGGRFEYTESPFIREYMNGGVFLFDEVDAFDPNCLLTVNQATANGGFEVESRAAAGLSTFVERHPESILIASANTYGTGSGSLYVGRSQLDAATLDRWYVVQMDYDREWEATIAPAHVCAFVWKLRDAIQAHKMRRVASTRMIQKAAKAVEAGIKWNEVQADLLSGWTAEEKSKAGV
jgi:cobaltochelatase CobS